MKYRNLIGQVVREDMPNLEQVRENCHRQAISQKPIVRKVRWSVAAAMAACFALVTVVYAASVLIQRFDTGGAMSFISVPPDSQQLQERQERMLTALPIYVNTRSDVLPRFMPLIPQESMYSFFGFEGFSAEDAQIINELLVGRIFTSYGEPFVLMAAIPNQNLYRADDGGFVLYDENSHEIGTITIATSWEGEFVWAHILTRTEFEEFYGYTATYQEGVALLGQYFRLPTIYNEEFDVPVFRLEHWTDSITGADIRSVVVRYMYDDMGGDVVLVVETSRNVADEPLSTLYTAAEITEIEIAGITVTQVAYDGSLGRFSWIYDNLVYTLFPPNGIFTADELLEIIRSMIE
jgi:hypothetical protein